MDYEIRALTAGDESIELLNILQISSRSILWLRAERGFGIMLMPLIMGAVQISLKHRLKIATLPVLPMPTIVIVEELRKSTDK